MNKTVAYIRCSSCKRQVTSFASQEKKARAYARQNNLRLVEIVKEAMADKMYLGSLANKLKRGEISDVVVVSMDRLYRDPEGAMIMLGLFEKYGVKVHTIK